MYNRATASVAQWIEYQTSNLSVARSTRAGGIHVCGVFSFGECFTGILVGLKGNIMEPNSNLLRSQQAQLKGQALISVAAFVLLSKYEKTFDHNSDLWDNKNEKH